MSVVISNESEYQSRLADSLSLSSHFQKIIEIPNSHNRGKRAKWAVWAVWAGCPGTAKHREGTLLSWSACDNSAGISKLLFARKSIDVSKKVT